MRKPGPDMTYLVVWDAPLIAKAGVTSQRRWRRFAGCRLVAEVPSPPGTQTCDIERLWDRVLSGLGSPAFRGRHEAIPYLDSKGGGYLECYRFTSANALAEALATCLGLMPQAMPVAMPVVMHGSGGPGNART